MRRSDKGGKSVPRTVVWDASDWADILALRDQIQASSVGRITVTDVIRLGVRELAKSRLRERAA